MNKLSTFIVIASTILFLSACSTQSADLPLADRQATAAVIAQTQIAGEALVEATSSRIIVGNDIDDAKLSFYGFLFRGNTRPWDVVFRDDFNGSIRQEWFWENELSDLWTITEDGKLQFSVRGDDEYDENIVDNLLTLGYAKGDFEVVTHVNILDTSGKRAAGIFVSGDADNFIQLAVSFCDIGDCFYGNQIVVMQYKINGIGWFFAIPITGTEMDIKLVIHGYEITSYYSTTEGEWIKMYTLNKFYDFDRFGLFSSDQGTFNADKLALAEFDYMEVKQPAQ